MSRELPRHRPGHQRPEADPGGRGRRRPRGVRGDVRRPDAAAGVRGDRPGRLDGGPPRGGRLTRLRRRAPGLQAIGVTGQMHGVVLAREDGRPTRPAVLWPDQRAASVLPRWLELPREARARLANPLFAGMAGPMLTWLRQNEPADLDAAGLVRSPKDWLRAQLTGDRVTERSDASATLLWDVTTDDWSTAAIGCGRGPGRSAAGGRRPATRWWGRRPGRRSTTAGAGALDGVRGGRGSRHGLRARRRCRRAVSPRTEPTPSW